MDISYNLLLCMIRLNMWNEYENDNSLYEKYILNFCNYAKQLISYYSGKAITIIDFRNKGILISRDISLFNTKFNIITCKNDDVVMNNRFIIEWQKVLIHLKKLYILCKQMNMLNETTVASLISEFWNRYEEFFHLLNITYKLPYVEKYLADNHYYERQFRIMVEYFSTTFVYRYILLLLMIIIIIIIYIVGN